MHAIAYLFLTDRPAMITVRVMHTTNACKVAYQVHSGLGETS